MLICNIKSKISMQISFSACLEESYSKFSDQKILTIFAIIQPKFFIAWFWCCKLPLHYFKMKNKNQMRGKLMYLENYERSKTENLKFATFEFRCSECTSSISNSNFSTNYRRCAWVSCRISMMIGGLSWSPTNTFCPDIMKWM